MRDPAGLASDQFSFALKAAYWFAIKVVEENTCKRSWTYRRTIEFIVQPSVSATQQLTNALLDGLGQQRQIAPANGKSLLFKVSVRREKTTEAPVEETR